VVGYVEPLTDEERAELMEEEGKTYIFQNDIVGNVIPPEVPYIHHTPYTIHHTLYTIHHTPYTIHHTPYTIHHTPYTIPPEYCRLCTVMCAVMYCVVYFVLCAVM
jgi:hypothetical protein